jgi:hypothetical protein
VLLAAIVLAVAAFLYVVHDMSKDATAVPSSWDVLTQQKLSARFVGGATPRFDEPGRSGAGGDALTTILGLHALRLLAATSPAPPADPLVSEVRRALQAGRPAAGWAAPERWLLSAGLGSGSVATPDPAVRSRYAEVHFGLVAAGRSPCAEVPAGDAGSATAALVAARARCRIGSADDHPRSRLLDQIRRRVADGDAVTVWRAAEATCLLTGRPPDLTGVLGRLAAEQVLPDGGVAAAPGGPADVAATYAYLRLRVLTKGCSPAWWAGYP